MLGIMRHSTRYMLLGFAVTCMAVFTGCISQRAGAGLGAVVLEAAVKPMFDPVFELACAANEFRETKKRWPKDYDELSSFLKRSDDKTYQTFQTVKYQRIDFSETTDGKLKINADYTFSSRGAFSSGGTFSSRGTGRIEGMEVGAFDPHEMRLMPITALEPTATAPPVSTNK